MHASYKKVAMCQQESLPETACLLFRSDTATPQVVCWQGVIEMQEKCDKIFAWQKNNQTRLDGFLT